MRVFILKGHQMNRVLPFLRVPAVFLIACLAQFSALPSVRASDEHPGPSRLLRMKAGEIDTNAIENLLFAQHRLVVPNERLILQIDGPMTPARSAVLLSTGLALGEYLPDFAYVVDAANVDFQQLQSLGFVLWVGRFDPAWRLDPELGSRPLYSERRIELRAQGLAQVVVVTFSDAGPGAAVEEIVASGSVVLGQYPVGSAWMIDAIVTPDLAVHLAALPTVQYVEEAPDGVTRNHSNRWILQSNVLNVTPVWDHGLHGEGQIAGLIDTTVYESHCMFDDALPPGDPNHRKLVGWRNPASAQSHGTHVAGTLAGDAPPYGVYTINDGLAYAARLSFSNLYHLFANPSTLYQRLLDAHNDGARVHNNSWGDDGTRNYTTWCRQMDDYSYTHEDGMVAVAISYSAVVTTPENALSSLAVAACDDAPIQDSHWIGGTGPTLDGRRKPEVFAPGHDTMSASMTTCSYAADSGTSMACPAVSAAAVLARQYFLSGFYPSGAARGSDGRNPSGALLRAIAVNGSVDMTGIPDYPSDLEGWGRVLLDNGLYFVGDAAKLLVEDVWNADGLATGEFANVAFEVLGSQTPLRVTMAYTQPPAAVNAADPVINDLDLEILAPDGALYRGNFFTAGESAAGGSADARNSVERVIRNAPSTGLYTATIRGRAVNAGQGIGLQGFALVVNGDIAAGCAAPPIGDLDGDCQVGLADLSELLATFGVCSGEPGFNAAADFDTSGCIDLGDLAALLAHFGA
jgi:subtilisin family serine protease